MTAPSIALVLLSCVLHAGWNLLVKRARDKDAFTALYLAASCVLYLPLMVVFAAGRSIPSAGWACILGSGTMYAAYFLALGRAYRHGDLSYAYPVARGLGPPLAALVGVMVLRERVTIPGGIGIALIVLAVAALHMPAALAGPLRIQRRALGWATVVGVLYAGYSIVDKVGVGKLGVHPVVYIYLAYATSAAAVIPVVAMKTGFDPIREEWRLNGPSAVAVGLLNVGAYLLVLCAMALPNAPVSYVVPLRTVSVLFGVMGGVGVLGERGAGSRVAAALMVMAGVALIAWKG